MKVLIRNSVLAVSEDQEIPSVLNPTTGKVYLLSNLGLVILKSCDGSATIESLIETIAENYPNVPRPTIETDVEEFIQQGLSGGLLVWQDKPTC